MTKERIGLFGGTFNPIHNGHIQAAGIVKDRFKLDSVLFVPSHIPPHKESEDIASPIHRLEMVKLAVSSVPGFQPSSMEIEEKGTSYSIDTLRKIRKAYPGSEVYFILGIDAFLEIETWKDTREVLKQCVFVVVSRPGYDLEDARHVLQDKSRLKSVRDETDVEDILQSGTSAGIFLFPIDSLDVSSTAIRCRIRQGESITGMVPVPVEKYISSNKLYQGKK